MAEPASSSSSVSYTNSIPLDLNTLLRKPLTKLPIRLSSHQHIAKNATKNFAAQMTASLKHFGIATEVDADRLTTSPGSNGSFVSLLYPECLPERIEPVSLFCDLAFGWDDLVEALTDEQVSEANRTLINSLTRKLQVIGEDGALAVNLLSTASGENGNEEASGEALLIAALSQHDEGAVSGFQVVDDPIVRCTTASVCRLMSTTIIPKLVSIDPKLGAECLKIFLQYLEHLNTTVVDHPGRLGCPNSTDIESTLSTYLHFRRLEAGTDFYLSLIRYSLGITFSSSPDLVSWLEFMENQISDIALLTNDLYSYDREIRDHEDRAIAHAILDGRQDHDLPLPGSTSTSTTAITLHNSIFLLQQTHPNDFPSSSAAKSYIQTRIIPTKESHWTRSKACRIAELDRNILLVYTTDRMRAMNANPRLSHLDLKVQVTEDERLKLVRYLDALELSAGGNSAFCAGAQRYDV